MSPANWKMVPHHLVLQGWSHWSLELLTFDTPWKKFRAEIRKEAFCALGKTGRTCLQIVRPLQEKILRAILVPPHAWKSTNITKRHLLLMICSHLPPKRVSLYCTSRFTKLTYTRTLPPTSQEQFLRGLRGCLPRLSSSFLSQIKLDVYLFSGDTIIPQ